MSIGPARRSLSRLITCTAAFAALTAVALEVQAQAPPGIYRGMPQGGYGPAGCGQMAGDGGYGYGGGGGGWAPTCGPGCGCGHGGGCGPGGCDPYGQYCGAPQPGFTGPMPMGYGGTNPPIGYDLMNDVGMEGCQVDQRGPHYFDIRAEAVYLTRDETFGRDIGISQEGLNGPIVLSTGQLDYDYQPGFRIIGRYDICPLSVVEFGYTGIFDFEDSARYVDPNAPDLFSLFSDFGVNPITVSDPFGPMPESERAVQHRISIESDLQTAEISWRRYWLGWSPRVSGTLLAGFRYTKLNEEFLFQSFGSEPSGPSPIDPNFGLAYGIDAENNLSGFQTGGDIWVGLTQGLRIGAEGKAGIYANRYSLTNQVTTTPLGTTPPTLFERYKDTQPAFIAEASADLVADLWPSISLRVGYEVLFINSIVLSGDNFNTGSPYNTGAISNGLGPQRVPFVNDQSDALYHGGHIGLEYIW